jgi:hypothetical protein
MNFLVRFVLPLFYFVLLAFLLVRNKYLLQNGISKFAIVLFFTAKCVAGILADFISLHYFRNGGDNWLYFSDGLKLYQTLMHDPPGFVLVLKQMFTVSDFGLLNPHSDFIRTVFEGIKFIHFIGNIFSFGSIYTNTILFNALACLSFLRCWIFLKKYTGDWMAGAWIFLIPSAFFYTGNILKEGIAYVLIAALLPLAYKVYSNFKVRLLVPIVMLFLLLFFFKFVIAATFGGALLVWFLLSRYPRYKSFILFSSVALAVTVFFISAYVPGIPNFPQYLISRQQEFMAIEANSAMHVYILKPGIINFVKALPVAIGNVLFKPLPGEGGKLLYLAHSFEIYLFWGIVVFMAIKNKFRLQTSAVRPLFFALLLYAMANLLIIGYIVPSVGAIVRYRSIFLPFVAIFFWYLFDGKKHLFTRAMNANI